MAGEVDRAEVADRRLLLRRDLEDLGAKIGAVDHPTGQRGLVAKRIGPVLEADPAVAGLGEGAHHPSIELARRQHLAGKPSGFGLPVSLLEGLAVKIGQLRHIVGIEQRPRLIGLDSAHEQIGDPVGDVEVMGPPHLIADVVAKLEKLLDVGMPGLEVHAAGPLAPTALIDRGHRAIERLQPGHDAARTPIRAADQAAASTHAGEGDADAAGKFGELGDFRVALVNPCKRILWRIEQKAGGHLLVPGSRVEKRRRARQVLKPRKRAIKARRFLEVLGQGAGDAQEKVLRTLDRDALLGVPEQVAVVDCLESEVTEEPIGGRIGQRIEHSGVASDEVVKPLIDQAQPMAEGHRLGKASHPERRQILGDESGEHPRRERRVLGVFDDQHGRVVDRKLIELAQVHPRAQARNRGQRHPQGIDSDEIARKRGNPLVDLFEVHRLPPTLAPDQPRHARQLLRAQHQSRIEKPFPFRHRLCLLPDRAPSGPRRGSRSTRVRSGKGHERWRREAALRTTLDPTRESPESDPHPSLGAGAGRSSGSGTRGETPPTRQASQGRTPQCLVLAFVSPYRCGAAPIRTGFPFHPGTHGHREPANPRYLVRKALSTLDLVVRAAPWRRRVLPSRPCRAARRARLRRAQDPGAGDPRHRAGCAPLRGAGGRE